MWLSVIPEKVGWNRDYYITRSDSKTTVFYQKHPALSDNPNFNMSKQICFINYHRTLILRYPLQDTNSSLNPVQDSKFSSILSDLQIFQASSTKDVEFQIFRAVFFYTWLPFLFCQKDLLKCQNELKAFIQSEYVVLVLRWKIHCG